MSEGQPCQQKEKCLTNEYIQFLRKIFLPHSVTSCQLVLILKSKEIPKLNCEMQIFIHIVSHRLQLQIC